MQGRVCGRASQSVTQCDTDPEKVMSCQTYRIALTEIVDP